LLDGGSKGAPSDVAAKRSMLESLVAAEGGSNPAAGASTSRRPHSAIRQALISPHGGEVADGAPSAAAAPGKSEAVTAAAPKQAARQAVAAPIPPKKVAGAPLDAPEVPASAPAVAPEMVIQYQKGELQQNIVLRVQDTGGQPVFLPLIELLSAPTATIHAVVFSLTALRDAFETTAGDVASQLKAIQIGATHGAPILLVGTRKGDVAGGDAELRGLSDKMLGWLEKVCAPALGGLHRNQQSGHCFYAIENSRGYKGDATIRALVGAIEAVALKLPSMKQKVPLNWLRVHDALRALAASQRCVSLQRVRTLARQHGLPHAGLDLEIELKGMLEHFHALGALLWYGGTSSLRNLVVLDAQWVIDGATCFIRNFELRDHEGPYDQDAMRADEIAWRRLTRGQGYLQKKILDVLWQGKEFQPHKTELLDLMLKFGLVVPVPRSADDFIVPALLQDLPSVSMPPGWPTRPPDTAARLRLHFSLDGWIGGSDETLIYDGSMLRHGFLPVGVFHRLSAAALGCSDRQAGGAALTLERQRAFVAFDSELVMLAYDSENSSIFVTLTHDGKQSGAAANVADRLLVLISE